MVFVVNEAKTTDHSCFGRFPGLSSTCRIINLPTHKVRQLGDLGEAVHVGLVRFTLCRYCNGTPEQFREQIKEPVI